MPLWKIAWRSIQRRSLASVLTALSMALGVMLVVGVLVIHGIVAESFRNNSTLGYNMILGVKGGKLQLVLNTVFYLSQPIENMDYSFYQEFLGKEDREDGKDGKWKEYVTKVVPICMGDYYRQFRVVGTTTDMFAEPDDDSEKLFEFAEGRNFEFWNEEHGFFEAIVGARVAREYNLKVGDEIKPTHGSEEGEEHDKFFVVGILAPAGTPNDRAVFVNMEGFFLLDGHSLPAPNDSQPSEATVIAGAEVAKRLELQAGDALQRPVESDDESTADSFRVVGVLDPIDEVTDRAVFQRMKEDFLVEPPDDTNENADIATNPSTPTPDLDVAASETEADSNDVADSKSQVVDSRPNHLRKSTPLPINQREVTALLVRTVNPFVTPHLSNTINESDKQQAVLPVKEITTLFDTIVSPIQTALLAMTALICVVSGVGILVSIYNSMSDRNREIAIMRSLGAGRRTVMAIVLLESIMLALGGGMLGWAGGHLAIAAASNKIEQETGVQVGLLDFAPPIPLLRFSESATKLEKMLGDSGGAILDILLSPELLLIPTIMILAILVGFLPAVTAYKTDVAKALSANP